MTTPSRTYRKDYAPPPFTIETVELRFEIGPETTTVDATLAVRRTADGAGAPLVLHGAKTLDLRSVTIDGEVLARPSYRVDEASLTLPSVPDHFTLATQVVIEPRANTALMGLFESNGSLITQCEAEGFRRITYFLDRPDVMARYTTTIVADKDRLPVLLSNGNRVEAKDLGDGRHSVRWVDPFPKPSYLFALVAGDLVARRGSFTTCSGREVALEIWTEPRNAQKCDHALHALQKAMAWDEQRFGLEYDLDLYMVVAASDFNMGAMENKGLNVFNAKYVLAEPQTATDDDYEAIEEVIAHEYFHNWTGNRVTCRDWFQLTLKEGLTVFRDQEFTADETSRPVKRISDVRALRLAQFPEDAGPMAHPIRPESYVEMNNFYTATVYNKGAEVVRMVQTLLGRGGFRKGLELYFQRHDGQAVTCDDFRGAMADANGIDLVQFERWYRQPGTPTVEARGSWNEGARRYDLTLRQRLPEVAGSTDPQPLHVPVAVGLLGPDGAQLATSVGGRTADEHMLELRALEQTFTFEGVDRRPVPSILRGFSAPVKLAIERGREELAFLMAHDADPFSRWDAGQALAQGLLLELVETRREQRLLALDPLFVEAFRRLLVDPELDGSFRSLALTLPSERQLGQAMDVVDPDGLHAARRFVVRELASTLRAEWTALFEANDDAGAYRADRASIDRRRVRNCALAYLGALEEPQTTALARAAYERADNMTDRQAALSILSGVPGDERREALDDFHRRWKDEPLVLDKWFTVQAVCPLPGTLDEVRALARHEDFKRTNPNRTRALIGAFGQANQVHFHAADGGGYRFVADEVLVLDPINPQVASRLVSCFNSWKRFDADRQAKMKAELERIDAQSDLSLDVREIVERALGR